MQSAHTDEESYELTQSHVEQEDLEQSHLLKEDSSSSEDEEWTVVVDEQLPEIKPESPLLRCICLAFTLAVAFLVARILMNNNDSKTRPPERLYSNGTHNFATTVILISLDGFRPDYLERDITPYMDRFAKDGVSAKYIHPAFPPSTFPNHWSIITGLHPEVHGIVGNEFYDPDLGMFQHSNATITSDHRWWKGEPLWFTLKKNQQKSASIMWPGSNTRHNSPDYVVNFNNSMTVNEKMQKTLDWLDLPDEERPQLITIYVQQTDQEGHRGGPNSPKMKDYIKEIDESIGYLKKQLEKRHIGSFVHTVIVSDHGMSTTSEKRYIYYDDILPKRLLKYISNRIPTSIIHFQPEMPKDVIDEIYGYLSNYTQTYPFQVYLRRDMPDRFHHKHSNRISPIQVIPDTGYAFATHQMSALQHGDHHGYDNLAEDMRAIFLAKGPKIYTKYIDGSVLAPFFNIEVYSFIANLLNIEAAPNNGTMESDFPIIYKPLFQ